MDEKETIILFKPVKYAGIVNMEAFDKGKIPVINHVKKQRPGVQYIRQNS